MVVKFTMIADRLKAKLRKSSPGTRLPSEPRLAEEFSTTVMTVRKALDELEKSGLVRRVPKVGTFAAERKKETFRIAYLNTGLLKGIQQDVQGALEGAFPEYAFEIVQLAHGDDFSGMDLLVATANSCVPISFNDDLIPFPYSYVRRFLTREYFHSPFQTYSRNGKYYGLPILFSPSVLRVEPEISSNLGGIDDLEKAASEAASKGIRFWNSDTAYYLLRCLIFSFADHGQRLHSVDFEKLSSALEQCFSLVTDKRFYADAGYSGVCAIRRDFRQGPAAPDGRRRMAYPVPLNDLAGEFLLVPGGRELSDTTLRIASWFLSDDLQDRIGHAGYGIPILKTAAMDSFVPGAERDALFLREVEHMLTNNVSEYEFLRHLWMLVFSLADGTISVRKALEAVEYEIKMAKREIGDPLFFTAPNPIKTKTHANPVNHLKPVFAAERV